MHAGETDVEHSKSEVHSGENNVQQDEPHIDVHVGEFDVQHGEPEQSEANFTTDTNTSEGQTEPHIDTETDHHVEQEDCVSDVQVD